MTESFTYSDYAIYGEKESKIIPGKRQSGEIIATGCPRCSHLNKPIGHGETIVCNHCGLFMTVYGNSLQIKENSK